MTLDTEFQIEEEAPAAPSIPHNREAEEGVIGSVLINPNCLYDLLPILKSDHFYIHRHRWIWEAVVRMDERREPIDPKTLAIELEKRGQLVEIGGPAFITSMINNLPSSLNAEYYAKIVRDTAVRRAMINAANSIAQLAYNERKDITVCLSQAMTETQALEILNHKPDFTTMGALLADTVEDVAERAKDPKEVWGLATGLPTFDRETGGVQIGELTYVVGAPGVGKTWLDLTWGVEFGRQEPGAIISLEMRKGAIGRRLLAGITGVSARAMKSGYVKDGDWPLLTHAVEEYDKAPIIVSDGSCDTNTLRSALVWAKREIGIRWFILDYAMLLMDKGADETEQSRIISANLKRIVQDLNLAGVVLHSVTKVGMDGNEPRMSEQRGSGQAIHDADVQLFITKLYDKDSGLPELPQANKDKMATLWCAKGRDLERSKFKVHLTRRGTSPFWAEFDGQHTDQSYNWEGRKDLT